MAGACLRYGSRAGRATRPTSYAQSGVLGGAGVSGPAALVLLEHRHRTPVTDAAADTRLGSEDRLPTPTAPLHMAVIACAKYRRHRPAGVAIGVRVGTTRRRGHDPSALRAYQVAHEVIRKLIAPLPGHDVLGPQWAAAAPYLCNCVHAVDRTFDLASAGPRPEIMKMTPPYIPAIVTVTKYFAVCLNDWLSMAIRQAVRVLGQPSLG